MSVEKCFCVFDCNNTSLGNSNADSTSSLQIISVLNQFESSQFCEKDVVFFNAASFNKLFQGIKNASNKLFYVMAKMELFSGV